jgi:pimeloyl-ACP methyl ester carboxylesterase
MHFNMSVVQQPAAGRMCYEIVLQHGAITDPCDIAEDDAVVIHNRSASSRLEAALFDEGVLRDHSVRVLAVDRPGHGESSPHPTRNLTTFAGMQKDHSR